MKNIFRNRIAAEKIILLLLITLLPSVAAAEYTTRDLQTAQKLCEQIISQFPPSEYHYVGIGRSPTVLIAFLQNLHPGSATNIPFSSENLGDFYKYRRDRHQAPMAEIFSKFFPSDTQIGNKKILLIDYTISGDSLLFFAKALKDYVGANDRKHGLSALALHQAGENLMAGSRREFKSWNIEVESMPFRVNRGPDGFFQKFRSSSEYPSYRLLGDSTLDEIVPRPEYQKLLHDISQFLGNDCVAPGWSSLGPSNL